MNSATSPTLNLKKQNLGPSLNQNLSDCMVIDLRDREDEQTLKDRLKKIVVSIGCKCRKSDEIFTILHVYTNKISKLRKERDLWKDECKKLSQEMKKQKKCNSSEPFLLSKELSTIINPTQTQLPEHLITEEIFANMESYLQKQKLATVFELLSKIEDQMNTKSSQETDLEKSEQNCDQSLLLSSRIASNKIAPNNLIASNKPATPQKLIANQRARSLCEPKTRYDRNKGLHGTKKSEGKQKKPINFQDYVKNKIENNLFIERMSKELQSLTPKYHNYKKKNILENIN